MAKTSNKSGRGKPRQDRSRLWRLRRRARRFVWRGALAGVTFLLALVILYRFVGPPLTHTIWVESRRLNGVEREWVSMDDIAPVAARAVVAAEDADYCLHWGFDMGAIRAAIAEGAERGGSTISQQTVKNVFLWQGRNWLRKALEAAITPLVEIAWPKRRILEVYLNVAEFGEGVFGIGAAARHYFGVTAAELDSAQAARLAVVLPNPRQRDPRNLPTWLRKRAARVQDGAATIRTDGRAACFES